MLIYDSVYLLLGLLVISRLKFRPKGFYPDYLSLDTTNAVKGVFIALVFIKHATPYILNSGYVFDDSVWSKLFLFIDAHVGQWIVAMFLFYSGYGVMQSVRKKGVEYIASIPRKRVLTTLANFDIAVALFALVSLFTSSNYTLKHYLLSFIAWESVGNSNWYIFVIILCYLFVYVAFYGISVGKRLCRRMYVGEAIVCSLLLMLTAGLLSLVKPTWWYDTMLCFGFGIFYSILREPIESFFKRYYWLALFVSLILLVVLGGAKGIAYNFYSIAFCSFVVMLTMKLKLNNPVLIWTGRNLFPLYIYQRIPMIVFSSNVEALSLHHTLCLTHCYACW